VNFRYLFAAVAAVAAAVACWALADFRGFLHFFGIDTQTSDNYCFWSGVGPCLVTLTLGSGVLVTIWRHLNCHADRCPKLGRFPVAGGRFKVCRRHHGEVTGHHRLPIHVLRDLHHRDAPAS
jgi:hypothetical protein